MAQPRRSTSAAAASFKSNSCVRRRSRGCDRVGSWNRSRPSSAYRLAGDDAPHRHERLTHSPEQGRLGSGRPCRQPARPPLDRCRMENSKRILLAWVRKYPIAPLNEESMLRLFPVLRCSEIGLGRWVSKDLQ
ncbi:hypothetical protein ACP70R_033532 [Stipagrostis hirtigluma subsp. patula]